MLVSRSQKNSLLKAAKIIEDYCLKSSKVFKSYDEKLKYAAALLPDVFSNNTKYSKQIKDNQIINIM